MRSLARLLALLAALVIPACGTGSSGGGTGNPPLSGWAWMKGSAAVDASGIYGTLNVAAAANTPGARFQGATWVDLLGFVWVFGGEGRDGGGTLGQLNDLWRFDGSTWTWKGGSNSANQGGVYGTLGVPAASNVPGARSRAVTWLDGAGNVWLFGGYGYDGTPLLGYLNDLWVFDGTNWTWMGGSSTRDQLGVYGTQGVGTGSNIPGGRSGAVAWATPAGLWLFGGTAFGETGAVGGLNDLWLFNGTNWTWMKGSKVTGTLGVYGTVGVPDVANVPPYKSGAMGWTVGTTLWLFGGAGAGEVAGGGSLNDLWTYDGTWTWVGGSKTVDPPGVYGTQGVAALANHPGGRFTGATWVDAGGIVWLFGGQGIDSAPAYGYLNDLWRFNGVAWTWMSGSTLRNGGGVYGTLGVVAGTNVPGARRGAMPFQDAGGRLWLLGGEGYDATTTLGKLNDVWRYGP